MVEIDLQDESAPRYEVTDRDKVWAALLWWGQEEFSMAQMISLSPISDLPSHRIRSVVRAAEALRVIEKSGNDEEGRTLYRVRFDVTDSNPGAIIEGLAEVDAK